MTKRTNTVFALSVAAMVIGACQTVHAPILQSPPALSVSEKKEQSRKLYLSVIEQLIQDGKAYAALAHLDEYGRSFGTDSPSQRLAADAWFVLGDLAKAEAGYRSVLTGAQSGHGEHGLGRVAAAHGDWMGARQHFDSAVKDEPTNSRFLNDLGCSLFHLNRLDEAEFTLRKAHELAPHDEEIAENIIILLAKTPDGVARLNDIFSDISDEAARADLQARLLAYAGDPKRSATR
jgi:Flp pilus assembly protein TadD